jgi:hypothetical protein
VIHGFSAVAFDRIAQVLNGALKVGQALVHAARHRQSWGWQDDAQAQQSRTAQRRRAAPHHCRQVRRSVGRHADTSHHAHDTGVESEVGFVRNDTNSSFVVSKCQRVVAHAIVLYSHHRSVIDE